MATLTIPERYRSGIKVLRSFSEEDVARLATALQTARVKKDLVSVVTTQFPSLRSSEIVEALFSLYQVKARDDISVETFVNDLADAMEDSGRPDLELGNERESFLKKMQVLLSVSGITILAKAQALQRDHEHIFHDAKILTDLRPVFRSSEEEPQDMIVEYTLKIVYHDGPIHKELYMALDAKDIADLRSTLDRAERKALSLKALLQSKGITQSPLVGEVD